MPKPRKPTPKPSSRAAQTKSTAAPDLPTDAVMTGERVYLRALELGDAPLLRRSANDPQVRATFFTNIPRSLHQQEDQIRQYNADPSTVMLVICARDLDGKAVGTTGFHRIDWVGRMATFSILLADPAAWGRGYGGEATNLMIRYGFDVLNLHRIQLHVFAGNEAGIKIYRKAGFREEGRLRDAMAQNGKYHDFLVMGLLEDEWRRAESTVAETTEKTKAKK